MTYIEIVFDASTLKFQAIKKDGRYFSLQEARKFGIEWSTDNEMKTKNLKIPLAEEDDPEEMFEEIYDAEDDRHIHDVDQWI